MKLIAILFLSMSTIALANDPHNNSGYNNRSIVKCSSRNNHRKTCHADTSGGVQLIKQLSRSSCHNNWGYTRNQIWVDNGCRAKFQLYVGNGGGHNNNSNSNAHNNTGYSNNSNTHNNSYGNSNPHNNSNRNYNSNSHNNSNRNYNSNSQGHNNQSYGNRIVCESFNSQRNSCSIPHGVSVSLYKQLSHSSCEHNWGFNDSQVWVTNGCRAEFSINNSH